MIRLEFQDRRCLHIHLAAWALLRFLKEAYQHNDANPKYGVPQRVSAFGTMLEKLFGCRVNVQIDTGRLNYINGYTAKEQGSLDFKQAENDSSQDKSWYATYRMLCKETPGTQDVFLDFMGAQHMVRSFETAVCYAPIPSLEREASNDSLRLYHDGYLKMHSALNSLAPFGRSFLEYCRENRFVDGAVKARGDRSQTLAVGVRFAYFMTDNYIGQCASMLFPHTTRSCFLGRPEGVDLLQHTRCYVGVINFLLGLEHAGPDRVKTKAGAVFAASAFPLTLPAFHGNALGSRVFCDRQAANFYLGETLLDELQVRSITEAQQRTFTFKYRAVCALYDRILDSGRGINAKIAAWNVRSSAAYKAVNERALLGPWPFWALLRAILKYTVITLILFFSVASLGPQGPPQAFQRPDLLFEVWLVRALLGSGSQQKRKPTTGKQHTKKSFQEISKKKTTEKNNHKTFFL